MDDALRPISRYQLAVDQAHAYLKHGGSYTEELWRWTLEGLLPMRPEALQALALWLEHHERDIAEPLAWDDHAMLRPAFVAVIGREPDTHG